MLVVSVCRPSPGERKAGRYGDDQTRVHRARQYHDIRSSGRGYGREWPRAVLQVDLGEFCQTMVQAAVEWLDANQENPTVQANLAEVMTVYPDGAGGIAGVPVVM